jgi:hypothetical protein
VPFNLNTDNTLSKTKNKKLKTVPPRHRTQTHSKFSTTANRFGTQYLGSKDEDGIEFKNTKTQITHRYIPKSHVLNRKQSKPTHAQVFPWPPCWHRHPAAAAHIPRDPSQRHKSAPCFPTARITVRHRRRESVHI